MVLLSKIRYEGYGPCGVAILVDTMTDNKNRTVAEVRHVFSKAGGSLGTGGSVAYLFSQQGTISFASGVDEDKIIEIGLDTGAEDVIVNDDGSVDVMTNLESFGPVKDALIAATLQPIHAEMSMEAATKIGIDNQEDAEKIMRLIDNLDALDDVQAVYSNVAFFDEVLEKLS